MTGGAKEHVARADETFDIAPNGDVLGNDVSIDLPRIPDDQTGATYISVNAAFDLNVAIATKCANHHHIGFDNRRCGRRIDDPIGDNGFCRSNHRRGGRRLEVANLAEGFLDPRQKRP